MKSKGNTLFVVTDFWLANRSKLFSFIKERVSDHFASEDILQDLYLKLHLSAGKIKNPEKLKAWVYQVARNTIGDYYRTKYRFANNVELHDFKSVSYSADESHKLNKVIDSLPEKYREPLVLADIKCLPHEEIAELMELSLSATKSRILRARKMLVEAMKQHCVFKVDKYGNIIECQNKDGEICFDPDLE